MELPKLHTEMIIFIFLMLIFSNSMAATSSEILYKKLKNIPDNELAMCRVKSNDFTFLCALNTRNYYNCKYMIGTKFTLPKCKPVQCEPCNETKKPVKEPVKAPASNPFLDAFKKATDEKESESVKPKQTNPLLDAINKLNAQKVLTKEK